MSFEHIYIALCAECFIVCYVMLTILLWLCCMFYMFRCVVCLSHYNNQNWWHCKSMIITKVIYLIITILAKKIYYVRARDIVS